MVKLFVMKKKTKTFKNKPSKTSAVSPRVMTCDIAIKPVSANPMLYILRNFVTDSIFKFYLISRNKYQPSSSHCTKNEVFH